MIYGREIRPGCHVIEVGFCLGGAERCVNQFLVLSRQRDVPGREFLLEGAELSGRQRVAESTRTAVREETDATVAQAKNFGSLTRAIVVDQAHDFTFAEMIASAIRTQLRNLFEKV